MTYRFVTIETTPRQFLLLYRFQGDLRALTCIQYCLLANSWFYLGWWSKAVKSRPIAHQSYLTKKVFPPCRREGKILYTIHGFYRVRRRVGYEGGVHTRFLCCSLHYHHLPFYRCFCLLLNTEHRKFFKNVLFWASQKPKNFFLLKMEFPPSIFHCSQTQ